MRVTVAVADALWPVFKLKYVTFNMNEYDGSDKTLRLNTRFALRLQVMFINEIQQKQKNNNNRIVTTATTKYLPA